MKWLFFVFALSGCVTTISDIDVSKVDQSCARQCTGNYSSCISVTAIGVPTALFQQCKEALQLCVKTCPAK